MLQSVLKTKEKYLDTYLDTCTLFTLVTATSDVVLSKKRFSLENRLYRKLGDSFCAALGIGGLDVVWFLWILNRWK